MKGKGHGLQAVNQGGCGRIEKLVTNAIDTALLSRGHCGPMTISNDLLQRNAVSSAAPGDDYHIRIFRENRLGRRRRSGCPDEFSACSLRQFGNPTLRSD